ncbi:TPA: hypothetical protein ACXNBL_000761 [Clostridioides difficile]
MFQKYGAGIAILIKYSNCNGFSEVRSWYSHFAEQHYFQRIQRQFFVVNGDN